MRENSCSGPVYLVQGFKLIFKPGLRRFVVIPLLINGLMFAALIWLGITQFDSLLAWLLSFLPAWLSWLEWLLWPLFVLLTLIMVFFSFTLLANLIGAPFNGLLAEAVEQYLTGRKSEGQGWEKIMLEVIPSLLSELRKILYFLTWGIPLLILFLIPGINLFAPFIWMLFSAWMLALQYSDYPMANHRLSLTEQRRRLARKPFKVLGFGGATLLATLIPIINFLVMPAAVAGATVMWLEVFVNDPRAPQKNL